MSIMVTDISSLYLAAVADGWRGATDWMNSEEEYIGERVGP